MIYHFLHFCNNSSSPSSACWCVGWNSGLVQSISAPYIRKAPQEAQQLYPWNEEFINHCNGKTKGSPGVQSIYQLGWWSRIIQIREVSYPFESTNWFKHQSESICKLGECIQIMASSIWFSFDIKQQEEQKSHWTLILTWWFYFCFLKIYSEIYYNRP